ncbi:MAG: transcriptional repressor NrdR [Clostridiaceae bacterium]|nr:transcriptional repressor NrdR [Clostridiaceae bacterium]
MKCPNCKQLEDKVIDSRPSDDGESIRRRRECLSCAFRFTTYERIEELPLFVIKRDGARELFQRGKVVNGLLRACEKRPVRAEQIDAIVDLVEDEVRNSPNRELQTVVIGNMLMDALRDLDEVAYVRFASVYRKFTDLQSFYRELADLGGKAAEGDEEAE